MSLLDRFARSQLAKSDTGGGSNESLHTLAGAHATTSAEPPADMPCDDTPSQGHRAAVPPVRAPFEVHGRCPDRALDGWLARSVGAGQAESLRIREGRGDAPRSAMLRGFPAHVVALDLETTGLGGGGAVPFVVGLLHGGHGRPWHLRQWVLTSMGGEAEMLEDCRRYLEGLGPFGLLTFNGKSFDVPVVHGRARRLGVESFALGGPHLDLLHPARRIWDRGRGSCRLTRLESRVLGVRRVGDIPGDEIPEVFWGALRAPGDIEARGRLDEVVRHNALDLLGTVALSARAASLHAWPPDLRCALAAAHPSTGRTDEEIAALLPPQVRRACGRGRALGEDAASLRRATWGAVQSLRRVGRVQEAVDLLHGVLRCLPGDAKLSGTLAGLLERHLKQPRAALTVAEASAIPDERRIARLRRRVARLDP